LETVKLSFDVETSDATCPLGIEIWLDDAVLLTSNHVQEKISFSHDMSDEDGEHELRIVLRGKTTDHTQVDEQGNIIKDATWKISNVEIDELAVDHLFLERCIYTHDFNGTQPTIEDLFYGIAGCNGSISLKFSTPVYLWLLENM
jgi:hypothetical protein